MNVKSRIVHNFPSRRSNIFQTFQQMKFVAREESRKLAELVMGICSDDLLRKKILRLSPSQSLSVTSDVACKTKRQLCERRLRHRVFRVIAWERGTRARNQHPMSHLKPVGYPSVSLTRCFLGLVMLHISTTRNKNHARLKSLVVLPTETVPGASSD